MSALKAHWLAYAVVSFVLLGPVVVFAIIDYDVSAPLRLEKGQTVEISVFRPVPTSLKVDLFIAKAELDKKRSVVVVESLPAACNKYPPFLEYVQEGNETLEVKVTLQNGGQTVFYDDSRSRDLVTGMGLCGAGYMPGRGIVKSLFSDTQANGDDPAPLALSPGWSKLKIEAVAVGPILDGDRAEVMLPGPWGIKSGGGGPLYHWLGMYSFFAPIYAAADGIWLLWLLIVTWRRARRGSEVQGGTGYAT